MPDDEQNTNPETPPDDDAEKSWQRLGAMFTDATKPLTDRLDKLETALTARDEKQSTSGSSKDGKSKGDSDGQREHGHAHTGSGSGGTGTERPRRRRFLDIL